MSGVAISLLVFGIYNVLTGVSFMIFPNVPLGMFGLPETTEPWIRVVGIMGAVVGYFYVQVAREDLRPFYVWSVYARMGVFLALALFVVLQWAPIVLIVFGVVDLLGAIWTYLAFRSRSKQMT